VSLEFEVGLFAQALASAGNAVNAGGRVSLGTVGATLSREGGLQPFRRGPGFGLTLGLGNVRGTLGCEAGAGCGVSGPTTDQVAGREFVDNGNRGNSAKLKLGGLNGVSAEFNFEAARELLGRILKAASFEAKDCTMTDFGAVCR